MDLAQSPHKTDSWLRRWASRLIGKGTPSQSPEGASDRFVADTHMEAMFRQSGVGICHVDLNGRYARVNQRLCEILGYDEPELLGKTIWDTSFTDNVDAVRKNIRRMIAKEIDSYQFENHYTRRDGKWLWTNITVTIVNDEQGETLYALCVVQDITEWKETKRMLRRGNEQTQIILDALPVAVALIDQDANLQYLNKLAREWYCVEDSADVIGRDYREIIPVASMGKGEGKTRRRWADKIEAITYDERMIFGDGKTRDVQLSIIPHVGDKNNLLGAYAMSIDMTEQKRTERQLIALRDKAEAASQAKSDFLATMSHEIRTPMNGVLGMLQLLLSSELNDADQEKADLAHESALALMDVLNDILDYSRIESGRFEISEAPFEICTAVKKLVDGWTIRAHDKGLELSYSCPDEIPHTLICDGTRVRKVLTSLVENAIKFTDEGEICVAVTTTSKDRDHLVLRFTVTDTGIGVEPDQQDCLFEQFSQVQSGFNRNYEGVGLGLAISKRLAELMGGEIGFESAPGKGSTFWFQIPCVIPETQHMPEQGSALVPAQAKRSAAKILVAEDHPVNQQVIMALLATLDVEFVIAENGREAVEAVINDELDLVLMDVRMPVMDGVTAINIIRGLDGYKADIPIIAITANAMHGDKEKYLAAGADAYIAKPIDGRELMAAVEQVQPRISALSPNVILPQPTEQEPVVRQAQAAPSGG